MSTHPHIPLDSALIDEIAARMDLRTPNREALEVVARHLDDAHGAPIEVVCDLATAVGKTYLAGGLIDYLTLSGVRHFLIVVPGNTILGKTINNLTPAHPKSILSGMHIDPLIITSENFNTGRVGAALRNDNEVKILVFTVQSLIKPKKSDRRARKHQEWLGEDLYAYLQGCDDLVVIADEHHVYSESAEAFHAAVRELDPMALVGLTATPAESDVDKVVYRYELARAIADQYVKTPVLVGRKDDAHGVETQLRDGLLLLEAKQKAADRYAKMMGTDPVNAVMFVVADTIDNANAIAETLRKPGMFEHNYEKRVLVVHSDAPEDALSRLEEVEDRDSDVRVIVSVSMLKEGWDVRNIFVICSFRPSISEALTEQTLGRGLRLPWGEYTGVELLDTVEVLSHERYQQLLEKAGVLIEGLAPQRVSEQPAMAPSLSDGEAGDTVVVSTGAALVSPANGVGATGTSSPTTGCGSAGSPTGSAPGELELVVTSLEERAEQAEQEASATEDPVEPLGSVMIPHVSRTVTGRGFSLADVPNSAFEQLGKALADQSDPTLDRKVLRVVYDPSDATSLRLIPSDTEDVISASSPNLPLGNTRQVLQEAILSLDIVESSKAHANAAKRLADAAIEGAGSEDALGAYINSAIRAAQRIIRSHYRKADEVVDERVESREFAPTRMNTRPVTDNRFEEFSKRKSYRGWQRSLHHVNWFDSKPERTFANVIDSDGSVEVWARLQRFEHIIEWKGGRYSPDFYVKFDGVNYLIEVKRDSAMNDDQVLDKKKAAERWARFVTDHGQHGSWRYVLVSEDVLDTARTTQAVIQQATS